MISQLGMNETVGALNYGDADQQPFLGYSLTQPHSYSEQTAAMIDRETQKLVEDAHNQAKKLLTEHRCQLETLAGELLEKEVMEQSDLMAILNTIAKPAPT